MSEYNRDEEISRLKKEIARLESLNKPITKVQLSRAELIALSLKGESKSVMKIVHLLNTNTRKWQIAKQMVESIIAISPHEYGALNYNPKLECWDLFIKEEALNRVLNKQMVDLNDHPIKLALWSRNQVISMQFYLMDYAIRIDKDPRIKSRLINQTARQLKKALQEQNQDKLVDLFNLNLENASESKLNNSFYSIFNVFKNSIKYNNEIIKSHKNTIENKIILKAIKNKTSEIPGFYSRKDLKNLKKKLQSNSSRNNTTGAGT